MKKKIYSIALSLCLVSSIALAPLNTTSTTVQAKAKKVKAKIKTLHFTHKRIWLKYKDNAYLF